MKRDLKFDEISDGKLYTKDDLAKISCNGCLNCSECCKVTDDTILLDPYDIFSLKKALNKDFNELLDSVIKLQVIDYVITPFLTKSITGYCNFLDEKGRCKIHDYRPGFCRLFPLGRIYKDDGNFNYFIQVHECPYPNKSKIKIKSWLGIERLSLYEEYIKKWHEITKNITLASEKGLSAVTLRDVNLKLLNTFFVTPFDTNKDFYKEFNERLDKYMLN